MPDLIEDTDVVHARVKSLVAENNALRGKLAALSRARLVGGESDGQSLWGAILAAPDARYRVSQSITASAGKSGIVLYGPYCRLAAGDYVLKLRLKAKPATKPAFPLVGVLEVVYEGVFVVRQALPSSDAVDHTIRFRISQDTARLLTGDRYEFRLVSAGAHDIEVVDLSLSQIEGETVGNDVALTDLLACGGASAARTSPFAPIVAAAASEGNVFFGPYQRLAPGAYRMNVELAAKTSGAGEPAGVAVDVVSENSLELGRREFALRDGGQTLELDFAVPAASDLDQLLNRLEFRMYKRSGVALEVRAVTCRLAGA